MTIDPRFLSDLPASSYERMLAAYPPRVGEGGLVYSGAVRLSWPSLTKPTVMKGMEGKATPKYQASGLFTHRNLQVLTEAVRAAIRLHYPNVTDPSALMNPRDKNAPLKDQGQKVSVNEGGFEAIKGTTAGYVPGFLFLTAKSTQRVHYYHIVQARRVAVLPEEVEAVLYAGCWVDLELTLIKSTSTGNPGVFFGLQGVSKIVDDRKFGGGGNGSGNPEAFGSVVEIENPHAIGIVQSSPVAQNDWDAPAAPAASASDWG